MFIPAGRNAIEHRYGESKNAGLMVNRDAKAATDETVDIVRKAYECEVHIMSQLPHCDNLVGILDQQEN